MKGDGKGFELKEMVKDLNVRRWERIWIKGDGKGFELKEMGKGLN